MLAAFVTPLRQPRHPPCIAHATPHHDEIWIKGIKPFTPKSVALKPFPTGQAVLAAAVSTRFYTFASRVTHPASPAQRLSPTRFG